MQVETYEAISLDEQGGDIINEQVSGEALALIESLGLEGQKALVHKTAVADSDDETENRSPYREMTREESRVFGTPRSRACTSTFPRNSIPSSHQRSLTQCRTRSV